MNAREVFLGLVLFCSFLAASPLFAQDPKKVPVILDTDIGSNIDDAFALGLLLNSPEVELRGVTTCAENPVVRAWMVCRFLTAVGKKEIPVAAGGEEQAEHPIEGQVQYRYHPAVLYNRTAKPIKQSAVDFLYQQLKADPGKITILTTGPLTNIAALLTKHPDCEPWIKKIIISGGATPTDGNKKWMPGSFNMILDPQAFQIVVGSKVPLIFVPGSQTQLLRPTPKQVQEIFDACSLLTFQIQSLYQLWNQESPVLSDPVAVQLCFDQTFCKLSPGRLLVTGEGNWQFNHKKGGEDLFVEYGVQPKEFLKWCADRLSQGKAALPKEPPNLSKLIPADNFPNRVHAIEDFETDIEKRWWMSGKVVKLSGVPGNNRACKGVLTQDFDDRMGDMKTMYNAVIFNPVPGPPMGKQPRLSFRYWLKGTDTLRVQIYSLTNGYHRCLTLKGLPQGQWQSATVDMTQVRKPDGTGGPLSENERIDDIQFYADPRAELMIDDIVLYDAPVKGETRPFPKKLLFTGIFDTGKQGKEWPGTFDIVKDGYFWKAAQSVPKQPQGANWLRLHLRGPRPMGKKTTLFFRYHLSGADSMKVTLVNSTTKKNHIVELKNLKKSQWAETTINFSTEAIDEKGNPSFPEQGNLTEEIHFLLPPGAELRVDDVLLYEL